MAHYLLSVYMLDSDESPTPEEIEQQSRDIDALNAEMMQSTGVRVFAGGLQPADTATVLQTKDRGVVTTDGPFAETKEQLVGFWILDVADLDAALAWAAKATVACAAPVEVRPFQDAPGA